MSPATAIIISLALCIGLMLVPGLFTAAYEWARKKEQDNATNHRRA